MQRLQLTMKKKKTVLFGPPILERSNVQKDQLHQLQRPCSCDGVRRRRQRAPPLTTAQLHRRSLAAAACRHWPLGRR